MSGYCCRHTHILITPRMLVTLTIMGIAGLLLTSIGTTFAEKNGATLIGRVVFKGVVAPDNVVDVKENRKFCGQTMSIQTIRLQEGGHGLDQAIVSLGDITTSPARTPEIRNLVNKHCNFVERINAARVGDKLMVKNLDPVLHNAHGKFGKRTILNVAQVPGGRAFRKKLKYTGQLDIQCDKHEFMRAHVMVFPHPYFSVTDNQGHFHINSVPAGKHRITVWHETLGQVEKTIDIPAHGTVTVDFEFRSLTRGTRP